MFRVPVQLAVLLTIFAGQVYADSTLKDLGLNILQRMMAEGQRQLRDPESLYPSKRFNYPSRPTSSFSNDWTRSQNTPKQTTETESALSLVDTILKSVFGGFSPSPPNRIFQPSTSQNFARPLDALRAQRTVPFSSLNIDSRVVPNVQPHLDVPSLQSQIQKWRAESQIAPATFPPIHSFPANAKNRWLPSSVNQAQPSFKTLSLHNSNGRLQAQEKVWPNFRGHEVDEPMSAEKHEETTDPELFFDYYSGASDEYFEPPSTREPLKMSPVTRGFKTQSSITQSPPKSPAFAGEFSFDKTPVWFQREQHHLKTLRAEREKLEHSRIKSVRILNPPKRYQRPKIMRYILKQPPHLNLKKMKENYSTGHENSGLDLWRDHPNRLPGKWFKKRILRPGEFIFR